MNIVRNQFFFFVCGLFRELACRDIVKHDGLRVLVNTAKSSQGHTHMQKLCLHAFSLISDTMGVFSPPGPHSSGGEIDILHVSSTC